MAALLASDTMAAEAEISPGGLVKTLAQHDAAIVTLSSRITGVESGLKTLQGEVHSGFASVSAAMVSVSSKLDKLDSRPQIDFSKIVSSVLHLAILFSMIIGGIIWIATAQYAAATTEFKNRLEALESSRYERSATNETKPRPRR